MYPIWICVSYIYINIYIYICIYKHIYIKLYMYNHIMCIYVWLYLFLLNFRLPSFWRQPPEQTSPASQAALSPAKSPQRSTRRPKPPVHWSKWCGHPRICRQISSTLVIKHGWLGNRHQWTTYRWLPNINQRRLSSHPCLIARRYSIAIPAH